MKFIYLLFLAVITAEAKKVHKEHKKHHNHEKSKEETLLSTQIQAETAIYYHMSEDYMLTALKTTLLSAQLSE